MPTIIKGTIYITDNINVCLSNLGACRTIVVADEPDVYNIPGKIGGSLLLPPYEALNALVDGDEEAFGYYYFNYLSNDYSVNQFVNIILAAIMSGINIIILTDSNGPDFSNALRAYFVTTFGLILGDSSRSFAYDITYVPRILTRLYSEDVIDQKMFLSLYPHEVAFDIFTVRKLAFENNLKFTSDNEMYGYFKKQALILKNGGIIRGVVKRL